MEPIFRHSYTIEDNEVDRFGNLKTSMILFFAQDVAGRHCLKLGTDYDSMAAKGVFWAVLRHKVTIRCLPRRGQTITLETWPMPTTRVAYPRATVAFDEAGNECFRIISIWVVMDHTTRAMILPGKSGITVEGILRGNEPAAPGSLSPISAEHSVSRTVRFSDLDRNGHMNNCRYLQWVADLLPSEFHEKAALREFTVCYLSEALEDQTLKLSWQLDGDGVLRVEGSREETGLSTGHSRVFAVHMQY